MEDQDPFPAARPPFRLAVAHEELTMTNLISALELELRPQGTVRFEGAPFGFGASFFHVRNVPTGAGATLHVHPYPETWLVLRGRVRFTVDGQPIDAVAGHIVVAPADRPHLYTNTGEEMLEMVCIHPSPHIIQTNLA